MYATACSNKKYLYIFNNDFYDDFNIVPYTCIGTVYIEVVTAIQTISFKKTCYNKCMDM